MKRVPASELMELIKRRVLDATELPVVIECDPDVVYEGTVTIPRMFILRGAVMDPTSPQQSAANTCDGNTYGYFEGNSEVAGD